MVTLTVKNYDKISYTMATMGLNMNSPQPRAQDSNIPQSVIGHGITITYITETRMC